MNQLKKITAIAIFAFPFFSIPQAKADNQFDVCLRELINSGVEVTQAQVGCADALEPKDLSYCVSTITRSTEITGTDALKSCYQVRRPIEMGNCVVTIKKEALSASTEIALIKMALDTCQASLLPFRHSECVVALSRTPEVADPMKAMETCISAEDFPRALYNFN